MLKSFATSQEASFASHMPTERLESSRIMNDNINPSMLLYSEQKAVEIEMINNKHRKPTNYCEVKEGSSGQFSTPFVDESSGYFEEYQHRFSNRDPSQASSRLGNDRKEILNQREMKLHNCNKVHDYQFLKAHEAKDSVTISSNDGDKGLIMKESMDNIENSEEIEIYDSLKEESNDELVSFYDNIKFSLKKLYVMMHHSWLTFMQREIYSIILLKKRNPRYYPLLEILNIQIMIPKLTTLGW